jgi:hypothetical protein
MRAQCGQRTQQWLRRCLTPLNSSFSGILRILACSSAVTTAAVSVCVSRFGDSMLAGLDVGIVLAVGCADGVLRAALPASGPRLVGVDASAFLL